MLPGISPPDVLAQGHKDACGCGFRGSRKLGTSKMLISCIKNVGHPWPENFSTVTKTAGGLFILRLKRVRRTVLVFKNQVEGQPVCNFIYLEKRREETR